MHKKTSLPVASIQERLQNVLPKRYSVPQNKKEYKRPAQIEQIFIVQVGIEAEALFFFFVHFPPKKLKKEQ